MSYVYNEVNKVEIQFVKKLYMDYESFSAVRQDITQCEMCSHQFQQEDNTNIAFVKNDLNKMICDRCANNIISNGAKETDW